MNSIRTLIILPLAFLLAFCSGDKKDEAKDGVQDSTKISIENTVSRPKSKEILSLKYKINPGEIIKYRLIVDTDNTQKIKADSVITQKMKQRVDHFIEVKGLKNDDKKGSSDIQFKITGINIDAEVGGEKYTYKSGQTLDEKGKMLFGQYEMLMNVPVTIKVQSNGEITSIKGSDPILKKLIEMQPAGAPQPSSEEKANFIEMMNQEVLKPIAQKVFRLLSDKVVGVDSSWSQTFPTKLGIFNLSNVITSTVTEIAEEEGDKVAKLRVDLGVLSGRDPIPDSGEIKYEFEDPEITGDGEILFSVTNNRLFSSKTITKVYYKAKMTSKDSEGKTVVIEKEDNTVTVNNIYITK